MYSVISVIVNSLPGNTQYYKSGIDPFVDGKSELRGKKTSLRAPIGLKNK